MMQIKIESKIGPLYLTASSSGLTGIFWRKIDAPVSDSLDSSVEAKFLTQAKKEITEFLDGKRKKFEVKIDFQGTKFQEGVWRELQKIPYGKTWSYKELAQRLNTRGVRAVGTANGRNPLSLIIPCHRVIASDGSLGGYGGGLPNKKFLLDLEAKSKD